MILVESKIRKTNPNTLKKINWKIASIITIAAASAGLYYFNTVLRDTKQIAITTPEIRGAWVPATVSKSMDTKVNMVKTIDRIKTLNLNTIYLNVFSRGYTTFPSAVNSKAIGIKIMPRLDNKGRDIVKETLSLTSDKKIKTFAWFEYGFMTFPSNPIVKKHPEWIALNSEGGMEAEDDTMWLNPINPKVQGYISNIIIELVTRYDIDGIQFDDHMALNSELGYDKYTLALYKKETGKQSPLKPNTDLPLDDPLWKEWLDWRSAKITSYMKDLTSKIKKVKPNLKVSIAVNYSALAYKEYCQQWPNWLDFIDEIIVQNYTVSNSNFNNILNSIEIKKIKKQMPVSVALGLIVNGQVITDSQMLQQATISRGHGLNGINFWYADFLEDKQKSKSRYLAIKSIFPEYAPR